MSKGVTTREAWQFVRSVLHHCLTDNGTLGPNPYGAQCVNLLNWWWAVLGVGQRYGNAADWIGQPGNGTRWLEMRDGLRLIHGDAAVLTRAASGEFGHVALIVDGSRRAPVVAEQNWPLGSCVELGEHSRAALAGVIRPDI